MATIKCGNCGAEVSDNEAYCRNCGNFIKHQMGCFTAIGMCCVFLIGISFAISFFSSAMERVKYELLNNNHQIEQDGETTYSNNNVQQSYVVPNTDDVKIKNIEFGENSIGDSLVYVTYEWTNNNDTRRSFMWTYTTKVYQDGIELRDGFDSGYDGDLHADHSDIKQFKTQTFTKAYELMDKKHSIDVEVEKYLDIDRKVIVSKSFKIE